MNNKDKHTRRKYYTDPNKIIAFTNYSPENIDYLLTHDNGGRPFKVVFNHNENEIEIYKLSEIQIKKCDWNKSTKEDDGLDYDLEPIYIFKYKKYFIGNDLDVYDIKSVCSLGYEEWGNSVLIELDNSPKNTYVYIGSNIIEFRTYNKIKRFYSYQLESDVIKSYAVDLKNNYYYIDSGYMSIERDDLSDNFDDEIKESRIGKFESYDILNKRYLYDKQELKGIPNYYILETS